MKERVLVPPLTLSLVVHGGLLVLLLLFFRVPVFPERSVSLQIHMGRGSGSEASGGKGAFSRSLAAMELKTPALKESPGPAPSWEKWKADPAQEKPWSSESLPTSPDDLDFSAGSFLPPDTAASRSPSPGVSASEAWAGQGDKMVRSKPEVQIPPGLRLNAEVVLNIRFSIPSEGGYPTSIEGIDSGNPEMDSSLWAYFHQFFFEPSLSREPYVLNLKYTIFYKKPQ